MSIGSQHRLSCPNHVRIDMRRAPRAGKGQAGPHCRPRRRQRLAGPHAHLGPPGKNRAVRRCCGRRARVSAPPRRTRKPAARPVPDAPAACGTLLFRRPQTLDIACRVAAAAAHLDVVGMARSCPDGPPTSRPRSRRFARRKASTVHAASTCLGAGPRRSRVCTGSVGKR